MKRIIFTFLIVFLIGGRQGLRDDLVDRDEKVLNCLEGRVIKKFFNELTLEKHKNQKVGLIISPEEHLHYLPEHSKISESYEYSKYRQTQFVAWFTYTNNDQHVVVNYFAFPFFESFDELFLSAGRSQIYDQKTNEFSTFLKAFNDSKVNLDTINWSKATILLPPRLQNDDLFTKMQKTCKFPTFYDIQGTALERVAVIFQQYYWGFMSDGIECIRSDSSYEYDRDFQRQIEREVLNPIREAIWAHDTPDSWKDNYREWLKNEENKIANSNQKVLGSPSVK